MSTSSNLHKAYNNLVKELLISYEVLLDTLATTILDDL